MRPGVARGQIHGCEICSLRLQTSWPGSRPRDRCNSGVRPSSGASTESPSNLANTGTAAPSLFAHHGNEGDPSTLRPNLRRRSAFSLLCYSRRVASPARHPTSPEAMPVGTHSRPRPAAVDLPAVLQDACSGEWVAGGDALPVSILGLVRLASLLEKMCQVYPSIRLVGRCICPEHSLRLLRSPRCSNRPPDRRGRPVHQQRCPHEVLPRPSRAPRVSPAGQPARTRVQLPSRDAMEHRLGHLAPRVPRTALRFARAPGSPARRWLRGTHLGLLEGPSRLKQLGQLCPSPWLTSGDAVRYSCSAFSGSPVPQTAPPSRPERVAHQRRCRPGTPARPSPAPPFLKQHRQVASGIRIAFGDTVAKHLLSLVRFVAPLQKQRQV